MFTLESLKPTKARKQFNEYVGKKLVYKITNLTNSKVYIGITYRIKRRIYEHIAFSESTTHKLSCYLHKSISKYGLSSFSFEIIKLCETNEELDAAEIEYIQQYRSDNHEFGYNLTSGGGRGIPNDITTLKKIASSHKVKIAQYNLEGKFIAEFESVQEASRQLNISDTDLHRCHKKGWSRNEFMFKKFDTIAPISIEPYKSKKGNNFKIKGRIPHNVIACKLIDKKTGEIICKASSLKELANLAGMDVSNIHRILNNPNHKKYAVNKE